MRFTSSILCAGLILSVGWLSAAEAGQGRGHGKDMGQVRQELNLTDEQKQQMKALREDLQKKQEELRSQVQSGALTPQEARAQMQQAREAHQAAVKEILTPEQQEQLEQHRQDKAEGPRAGMRNGRGNHMAPGPDMKGRLGNALGLTEEQKAQWQDLQKQFKEQMEQLHQSGQRPDRETMLRLREEHQAAFAAILTPEQLQKWEEFKKNGPRKHPLPAEESGAEPAGKPATKEESWGKVKSQEK